MHELPGCGSTVHLGQPRTFQCSLIRLLFAIQEQIQIATVLSKKRIGLVLLSYLFVFLLFLVIAVIIILARGTVACLVDNTGLTEYIIDIINLIHTLRVLAKTQRRGKCIQELDALLLIIDLLLLLVFVPNSYRTGARRVHIKLLLFFLSEVFHVLRAHWRKLLIVNFDQVSIEFDLGDVSCWNALLGDHRFLRAMVQVIPFIDIVLNFLTASVHFLLEETLNPLMHHLLSRTLVTLYLLHIIIQVDLLKF